MYYIYLITNKITGKNYVGATCNMSRRISGHKSALRLNRNLNERMQKDYNLYGESSFEYKILEVIEDYSLVADKEIYYIDKYDSCNNGYNMTYGGEMYGKHRASDDVLYKMHCAMLGNDYGKGKHRTEEQRKHYSDTWYSSRDNKYLHEHKERARNLKRKLSEQEAVSIRYRYLCGETPSQILKDFPKMSIHGLSKICQNVTWKHLPNTKEELYNMLINYQTN